MYSKPTNDANLNIMCLNQQCIPVFISLTSVSTDRCKLKTVHTNEERRKKFEVTVRNHLNICKIFVVRTLQITETFIKEATYFANLKMYNIFC